MNLRVGIGFDIHRLAEKRELWLGCVKFEHSKGLLGHSDGDVLAHAIADAMLGAAALGDIGDHFPPSDDSIKGISGRDILRQTLQIIKISGWTPVNVDCNVICEKPKIAPKREKIRKALAEALDLPLESVSVKARTMEKLGPIGEGLAIGANAVVMILRQST
jgi:2-C-methyl-D-erythritol 2,4-cyclodiphosphate synthase